MESESLQINILMVDDNESNLLSLETILQAPDRHLVRASSGEEALRYLLNQDAAVILLDVHMPHIDGLETAALIRGRERTRNVPIIFLTAYDSVGDSQISRGYSLGAVDYIIKPIDPDALKSKVAVFVELFRKTEQVQRQAELLREKNIELEQANLQRLTKLISLGQQLAAERDPAELLEKFCHAARDIVSARYAVVGMLDQQRERLRYFFTSGFDREAAIREALPQAGLDYLRETFKENGARHFPQRGRSIDPERFLSHHAPITSFLGAPILQQGKAQGWLYLADKLNADEFSEADERLTTTLVSQVAVAYENARLSAETQLHALALEQEIAERKQAEKERAELLLREQAARVEAETASRLKDEFLATVSHELRTPLNAILGWVHLVRTGLNEVDATRALETIERNARSQKRLIDDLLEVSRIITGKLRLDIQWIRLAPVVEAAIESVRPAAEAKGVWLRTMMDPMADMLLGDANRLQQVVWNLVSNAVKFTPPGGSVEICLKRINKHTEIVVSDTGVGITPEFLPYVFDRFRQADSSSTRQHGGLGLGLAIVRHLTELHGGTVRASSAGEGQGSSFTISLPLLAANREPSFPLPASTANPGIFLSDSVPRLRGLKVLVVDDQLDARELLAAIMIGSEAEVQTAWSAVEGLDLFSTWQPDILISDISMPGGDGLSFIRQIRERESVWGRHIPAIAVTAYASAEDRIRALAAGFQMHIPKPIEPNELVMVVASLTGKFVRAQASSETE